MSVTPIFDQLCRELGDPTEPEVSVEATDIGPDAVAKLEPESVPSPEEVPSPAETATEWSAPEERVA